MWLSTSELGCRVDGVGRPKLIATPGIAADARRRRRAGAVAAQAAAVVLLWREGRVFGGVCGRENERN